MGWINLGDPAPPGFFDGVHDTDPYYVSPEWEREQEQMRETLIPCASCSYGRVMTFDGYDPDIAECEVCHGRGYLDAHGDPIPEPEATVIDLTHMPPVPPELYAVLRLLIRSEQVPAHRVAELLGDDAFRAWMEAADAAERSRP